MTVDEIRERFLRFFEKKGHTVVSSDSLVPSNDPSLLFTGAGMNQFKDMFLGRGTLLFKRAASSQKCLRTGDLDNVGKTSGHHTFFEMLGHFSFGDYFKREAIPWTWEFYTRELGIPAERLYVSVYEEDDEAREIWLKDVGLPGDRVCRFGESDNFWPANAPSQGPNGPCGPCSELFYDFGPRYGCGSPTCGVGCGCSRYVEIGNIVFTQFDRQEGGVLNPLPQKNIDFGGGLERVAAVLQGVHSNFDIDIFKPILAEAASLLSVSGTAGSETAVRLRRIADHIRALTFCMADNALPSNTGRGYVVRRILRTALGDGVSLGHREPFLHRLVHNVVEVMKRPYPYLVERRGIVERIIKTEEEKFLDTLERGTELLNQHVDRLRKGGGDTLSGEDAFTLYDTFGFPIEMTESILREQKLKVDRIGFEHRMASKGGGELFTGDIFGAGAFARIKEEKTALTEFLGYRIGVAEIGAPADATVIRLIGLEEGPLKLYEKSKKDLAAMTKLLEASGLVESSPAGTAVAVLLDRTNFYAESGGQVGDSGELLWDEGRFVVEDCKRPDGYFFHLGRVESGTLTVGRKVWVRVDSRRRLGIMRNHTGTHLLQAALRAVLGSHVQQAGSVVEPDRLRFDFVHFQAMTPDEIRKVEDWVNARILDDLLVTKVETSMEEAKQRGAIAFFGEKYGDRVRIVSVGDGISVELCGGTHLERTGTIGSLKITTEFSIGSGIRRIEAVTGRAAMERARRQDDWIGDLACQLGCPRPDVSKKIAQLVHQVQELRQDIAKLKKRESGDSIEDWVSRAQVIDGERVVVERFGDRTVDDLRSVMDVLLKKKNVACALLAVEAERPALLIGVREDLIGSKGLKAGELAREIGKKCGGGGGGRDHLAQAGAGSADQIAVAMEEFSKRVSEKLKGSG